MDGNRQQIVHENAGPCRESDGRQPPHVADVVNRRTRADTRVCVQPNHPAIAITTGIAAVHVSARRRQSQRAAPTHIRRPALRVSTRRASQMPRVFAKRLSCGTLKDQSARASQTMNSGSLITWAVRREAPVSCWRRPSRERRVNSEDPRSAPSRDTEQACGHGAECQRLERLPACNRGPVG